MSIKPGLYIVATPIGNLEDISIRAISVLKHSNIILCEDTRVSSKLLAKYDIHTPLKVYNDNSNQSIRAMIERLVSQEQKIISIISDAGTPLISDPGYKLVKHLKACKIPIDIIPGACAAIAALVLSGIATDKFFFGGFLPKTSLSKQKFFKKYINLDATLVLYDTSHRILDSLMMALEVLGDRYANVSRELTKVYQESRLEKLSDLIEHYKNRSIKGEIVLVIERREDHDISVTELEDRIKELMSNGLSTKDISENIGGEYQGLINKKEVYQLANKIKKRIQNKGLEK